MLLVYENRTDGIVVEWKKTVHFPPHLHEAIEVVYVTDGDIELGVGQELYHMDEGDFAIVFPNVIHHYQVFGKKENKVIYLYLDPTLFPSYYKELQIYSPKNPVVKKEQVHPDVVNAIKYLAGITEGNPMLIQAYVQMILAHVFAEMPMVDKSTVGSDDLIYNAVDNGDDEVGGNAQNEAVGEPLQRFVASNCGGVGVLTGGDEIGRASCRERVYVLV